MASTALFTQNVMSHGECIHTASARRLCSSVRQFL